MRNLSNKSCRGNQDTHFVLSNVFLEKFAVYRKTWKIIEQRACHR